MQNASNKKCGIYFLFLGKEIIYIGKTTDLASRLIRHDNQLMPYNSVRFIACTENKLHEYETRWIKRFKPKENHTHKGRKKQKSYYIRKLTTSKAHPPRLNDLHMKFRILTTKSIFGIGHLKDATVQRMIDLGRCHDIAWIYYSLSHISFREDVLDIIKITHEWRIHKPGTDRDKGKLFLQSVYPDKLEEWQNKNAKNIRRKAVTALKGMERASRSKQHNLNKNRGY